MRISKAKLEVAFLDELRKLRPRPELLAIWRDIVRDVWANRKTAIENDLRIFESRVAEIKKRRKALTKAFVFDKAIEREDYDEFLQELKEELLVAEIALHEAQIDELDLEAVLNFAEKALTSAAKIWVGATLEQRQRFQAMIFPKGLVYSREEGFRNPVILSLFSTLRELEPGHSKTPAVGGFRTHLSSSVFRDLEAGSDGSRGVVARTGFEPVLPA